MLKIILSVLTASGTIATGALAVTAISHPEGVRQTVQNVVEYIEPQEEDESMNGLVEGLENENQSEENKSEVESDDSEESESEDAEYENESEDSEDENESEVESDDSEDEQEDEPEESEQEDD